MGTAFASFRTVSRLLPVAALTVSLVGILPTPASAIPPILQAGALKGVVSDISGHPRMGAVVLLFNRQDKLIQRALTNEAGGFAFADLIPDAYSVRVTLATFLPAVKNNIMVEAGKLRLLDVNLSTLFSSIQLLPMTNGDARTLMSDDWKWILRTSTSTRPVLRILPGSWADPLQTAGFHRSVFSDTRGLVRVSTGDSTDDTMAAGDLGTAFALATSVYGANHLKFSGNLGYAVDSGIPSAAFRTTYSRDVGGTDLTQSPEISVEMQQLAIPSRISGGLLPGAAFLAGGADPALPMLRVLSVSFNNKMQVSDSIDIVYGAEVDSISFMQRLNYASPYARLSWTGLGGRIDMTYTSGNARQSLGGERTGTDPELNRDLEALSMIPRVSLRESQAQVQRGSDYDLAYTVKAGSREYQVAGFREKVSNAALRISNTDGEFHGDLLADPYSGSALFDAGTITSLGYTVSATQNIGEHVKVTGIYGSSDVLSPQSSMLASDTSDDLRKLLHPVRRGQVTLRASAVVPLTGTRVSGSYQWTDYSTVDPAQIYSTQPARSAPGLNFTIRQPIPASFGLPWRMEATADVRNIRAQGYLPITAADGRQFIVVQNPRSFRGGLSFIF